MITVLKSEFEKLYNIVCANWKSKLDEAMKGQTFSINLEFTEDFVEEMKNACTAEQRVVFDSIFAEYIKNDLFTIKNIEEVYNKLNRRMPTIKDFDFLTDEHAKKQLNLCHIKHIEELFDFKKEEIKQETIEDELWGNVFAKIKQYGLNYEVLTVLKQNFNISKR